MSWTASPISLASPFPLRRAPAKAICYRLLRRARRSIAFRRVAFHLGQDGQLLVIGMAPCDLQRWSRLL